MESPILKQVENFSQKQKKHKQWMVVFIVLAVIVVFGTVAALRMVGNAMTHKEKTLNCQLQVHEHTEDCYDEDGNVICGYADYVVHTHNDDCYNADGELVCTLPEVEKHEHTEECYEEVKTLICGQEETDGHQHTEECYTSQKGDLVCEETEHSHTEECYDEEGNLICGMEEHQHEDDCYEWEDVLTCELEESESGHQHTEECYEVQKVLVCDQLELHTHTEECFEKIDENGGDEPENLRLICGKIQLEEHVHTEEAGCFEIVEAAGGEIAQTPETNEQTDGTSQESEEIITADTSSGTAGNEPEEYDETKTYEGSGYVVTASYNKDANIPEEAEFIAEQITEESDEENYKQHEAEFKASMEDEDAVMSGLFKIGFYVDGEEVEPESPVAITIRFVDENGLPEGTPVKIVHFADGENKVIDGGMAESGGTSFKTDGFSEFAVGFSKADADSAPIHISESYEYENAAFHITFHVEGDAKRLEEGQEDDEADIEHKETLLPESDSETAEGNQLEFELAFLDQDSEEYKAVVDEAAEVNNGGELLLAQAISYSMSYDGTELDLSECEVTAEIEPAKKLSRQIKRSVPDAIAYLQASEDFSEAGDAAQEDGSQTELLIGAFQCDDSAVTTLDSVTLSQENTNDTISVEVSGILALTASEQANPRFTVQYYANLEVVAYNDPALRKVIGSTSYTNELPVIDTTGGKLPANGGGSTASPNGNEIRNLYVDMTTGKLQTKTELTEVYSSRDYQYYKAPTINYMNALVENTNYELKEVWVLKEGKKADSTDRNDWDIHTYSADLHFTNREVSAENGEYVFISDGATLRLVYDTTEKDNKFETAFYDYDIGDGMIYSTQLNAQKQTGGKPTSTQGSGTYHMHTNQSGINSPGNYTGSGAKLAFGNANTGSGLQHELWGGNLLNKANQTQSGHPSVTGSYKGCTFGLVTGLKDGKVQYAGNVNAPNLFNDGSAAGKTSYDNGEFSLTFNRVGDTYTLTTVNGTGTGDLDTFNHPSPNASTVHNHIWTNNFWPMDSAASFGTDGHDMKFGDYTNRENYKFAGQAGSSGGSAAANGTFPWSDDGEDHNSYFGMHYNVEFDLVEDYVGPLEYYFFGDDDMWVFLDGKVVCDIGGVHSSVGEYVNLWDYLEKGSEESAGKHTLSFFYTERGESGSTCWMQFTLPTVSSLTPETSDEDYGHLKIEKTVTQSSHDEESNDTAVDNNDEFTFTIHFTDANGNNLPDDYSYVKYDKDGNEIDSNLIIWDGGTFTLKNGEYIIVKFLPQGTKYEVVETNQAITVTDNTSEESKVDYLTDITVGSTLADDKKDLDDNKTAEGEIAKGSTAEVTYNNKIHLYELPETGGFGMMIYAMAGALCILLGAGFMYTKRTRERRE